MDLELIELIIDAGIGILSISVISFLFYKTMQAHRNERKVWQESEDRRSERVITAIDRLSEHIRNSGR